jgi:dihydrofolate reductase
MRKLIVTMWVSLDGFVAGPNDAMNWVRVDQEMGQYEDDIVSSADTLVLGRRTYESFAGAWPYVPDNPAVSEGEKAYARKLNALQKLVFSKTLDKVEWNNSRLAQAIDPAEINRLKQAPGKDLLIYGSTSIVQELTRLGLIDEYQLLVHPVVLGGGKPLFKDPVNLKLARTKTFGSGVVQLIYEPEKK